MHRGAPKQAIFFEEVHIATQTEQEEQSDGDIRKPVLQRNLVL
jgi:hypothetical protein